ncbi:MAG: hypothetical protein ABIC04_00405 [Nanoarchaeota archaeon]
MEEIFNEIKAETLNIQKRAWDVYYGIQRTKFEDQYIVKQIERSIYVLNIILVLVEQVKKDWSEIRESAKEHFIAAKMEAKVLADLDKAQSIERRIIDLVKKFAEIIYLDGQVSSALKKHEGSYRRLYAPAKIYMRDMISKIFFLFEKGKKIKKLEQKEQEIWQLREEIRKQVEYEWSDEKKFSKDPIRMIDEKFKKLK